MFLGSAVAAALNVQREAVSTAASPDADAAVAGTLLVVAAAAALIRLLRDGRPND